MSSFTSAASLNAATTTASSSGTVVGDYRYYAPLPLRVVNEDFALLAGFLGGLLLFAVYVGVLVALRCVEHTRRAPPLWQRHYATAAATPTQHHSNTNSTGVRHFGVWNYGPQTPAVVSAAAPRPQQNAAAVAAAPARASVRTGSDAPHYERGVQLRYGAASANAPVPPPR